jgi:hypothetical protein
VCCFADAIVVKTTVDSITVYGQSSVGSFVFVAIRVIRLLVEAGTAGSLLLAGILTFYQNVAATAAVVSVVNTGFYITIQTYHGVSSFLIKKVCTMKLIVQG